MPLAGATVNLVNSSGTTITSTTADASGNYTFPGVALGAYTLTSSGIDSNGIHYIGSVALTVTGNQQNITINSIPGSSK
jgi:uncharacterized protein YfaS (alpha-2-macroglobulin family)